MRKKLTTGHLGLEPHGLEPKETQREILRKTQKTLLKRRKQTRIGRQIKTRRAPGRAAYATCDKCGHRVGFSLSEKPTLRC